MKRIINLRVSILMLTLFTGTVSFSTLQNNGGVIIVHTSNPSATITPGQVRLLYTRKVKRFWPNDQPIKPAAYKGKLPLQSGFYAKVLNMEEAEVQQYFKQRQFANSESMPSEVSNEAEMINYVSENAGAIGYVSAKAAETVKDRVKVICAF